MDAVYSLVGKNATLGFDVAKSSSGLFSTQKAGPLDKGQISRHLFVAWWLLLVGLKFYRVSSKIRRIPLLPFRTKLMLVLMIGLGLGIGILSGLDDGLYSAACLFVLPMLVVLAGASIIADLSQEQPGNAEAAQTERRQPDVNWRRRVNAS